MRSNRYTRSLEPITCATWLSDVSKKSCNDFIETVLFPSPPLSQTLKCKNESIA